MDIDLHRLLRRAFFSRQVVNATEAIELAREEYVARYRTGAFSFELVAPASPDETWARERLLRPLVFFCESEGAPIPKCAGRFLSLFVGDRLYCIAGEEVLEWAREQLGLGAEQLREQYGTHELETIPR